LTSASRTLGIADTTDAASPMRCDFNRDGRIFPDRAPWPPHRPGLVGEIKPLIQQRFRHRAIDHAGVEMAIAIMMGEAFAERALAGCRRPVDGDNHGSHVRQSGHAVKTAKDADASKCSSRWPLAAPILKPAREFHPRICRNSTGRRNTMSAISRRRFIGSAAAARQSR
jgi:hypothetical protein